MKQPKHRMTIEFPESVDDALKHMADADRTSKVEVIRRALALYDYVHKQTKPGAGEAKQLKLSLTDDEDKVVKDIVL